MNKLTHTHTEMPDTNNTPTDMISIIICSISPDKFAAVSKNLAERMGDAPFEIIGIHDARSLCEGYNRGIARSRGDILIFCHDDIEIITPNFHSLLRQHLKKYDLIGCAGTTRVIHSIWGYAGDPYIHGIVAAPADGAWPASRFNLHSCGANSTAIVEGIQALDGFFIAVNRRVLDSVHFDEQNFDGFHVYDIDFTFAAYLAGFKLAVCKDILIAHQSSGNFGEEHAVFSARFMEKYRGRIPVQTPNNYRASIERNLDRAQMLRLHSTVLGAHDQLHYWLNLGLASQAQGKLEEAIECFRKTLELKPDFAQAYNQLGMLLQVKGDIAGAVANFRQALKFSPGLANVWNNLGSALNFQGKSDDAIAVFNEAIRLKPDYVLAYNNLGSAYQSQSRLEEAKNCYLKSIELHPGNVFAHSSLGHILVAQWKMGEAERVLRQALSLDPNNYSALSSLAYALKEQSKSDEAASVYQQVLAVNPNDAQALIATHLLLPPVYASSAELSATRKRFADGLKTLRNNTAKLLENKPERLVSGLQWTNFYLAYQGGNDKPLQIEYAHFVADILRAATPDLMQPIAKKPGSAKRRLRIGFMSSFLRDCTIGKYFKTWITSLDKNKFEVFCYYTGHVQDKVTQELVKSSECYKHLAGNADYIGRQVKKDQLDILVYPEIGMDVGTFVLAAMRLAPVQCAAWGHPVTTGHANIDYFFSSALMEPEEAQAHYSEQLVLLDGIGTYYPKPTLPPPAKRSDFFLPEGKVLYLCPQSFFKIQPDNDRLMLEILQRNKDAVLVFFQAENDAVTRTFVNRLGNAFDACGLEKTGRVKMLPPMDHDSYLQVNMLCDVMLDTLHWSGGNTTLDAIASGLPPVTLPGEFMRGRQSYGMLKLMGLDELIAKDQDNYVEIAIRLGTDSAWRKQVVQHITDSSGIIFNAGTPLRQLEQFYSSQLNV